MATHLYGFKNWGMSVSSDGVRTYKITAQIYSDNYLGLTPDGPYTVYNTPGLPQVGDIWSFGGEDDVWAFCQYECTIKQANGAPEEDPRQWWEIDLNYSNIPFNMRCAVDLPGDPVLEPAKVSCNFVRYTKEAIYDMNGNLIANVAGEPIKGQVVEFDYNRQTIRIEKNVATLPQLNDFVDTLNDAPLWGFNSREIKLSTPTYERKIYGNCTPYWTQVLEFEINTDEESGGWDRLIPQWSTKVLNGKWNADGTWLQVPLPSTFNGGVAIPGTNPNPNNPAHYIAFTDKKGQPGRALLVASGNYKGTPSFDATGSDSQILYQYYGESNFLLLGIPTDLSDPTQ